MTTLLQDLPQIKGVKNIPLEEQFTSGHRTCQGCESALVMRLMGKDPLRRRFDPQAKSYWIERRPAGPEPQSMRRQF